MQLARHYQRPPDQLQREDIRSYLVHLAQQRRVAPSTYNQTHKSVITVSIKLPYFIQGPSYRRFDW
jgi:hypothetical protein